MSFSQSLVLNQFLVDKFSDIKVSLLPKQFKHSLAWIFSNRTKQEKPEGSPVFSTFPTFIEKLLMRKKVMKPSLRIKAVPIYWDLMQCKSLASKVPNDMIQSAYEKHAETLTQVKRTNPEILLEFREFCRPWAKRVAIQNLNETKTPSGSACLEYPRSWGGLRAALKEQSTSVPFTPLRTFESPRMEPVTAVLAGPPGCGKSVLVEQLIHRFMAELKLSYSDTVYHRTIDTDHWDGYNGQPIVIYDDAFQQNRNFTATSDNQDIGETITINSSSEKILPMADLKDKGQKFISAIVIYSTNRTQDGLFKVFSSTVGSIEALKRRLTQNWFQFGDKSDMLFNFNEYKKCKINVDLVFRTLKKAWETKVQHYQTLFSDETYSSGISQTVGVTPEGGILKYHFPTCPKDRLPNCSAMAIAEPLKVRMITKSEANCWVLKPLQKAMLKQLTEMCFRPCHKPINEEDLNEILGNKEGKLLSGDYTSATDGLHMDFSQQAMSVLSEELRVLGKTEMADWVDWEGGVHTIYYPSNRGLEPVVQTNGQLMGSLLSFPVLCMANAFTLHKATDKTLDQIPALFHGDDVAAILSEEEILRWKEFSKTIGLELSIGKNYVSDKWLSIDSQVFVKSNKRFKQFATGKFKGIAPTESGVSLLLEKRWDLKKSEVLRLTGLDKVRFTPRSIDVHTRFGGLNPFGSEPKKSVEFAVYTAKLLKSKPSKVCTGWWEVPQFLSEGHKRFPLFTQEISDLSEEYDSFRSVRRVKKKITRLIPIRVGGFEMSTIACSDFEGFNLRKRYRDLLASRVKLPNPFGTHCATKGT